MNKINLKVNKKNAEYIEPDRFYLYAFTIITNQLKRENDIQFNIKLEEGKIIFELSIDKKTQNGIFKEFTRLMNKGL